MQLPTPLVAQSASLSPPVTPLGDENIACRAVSDYTGAADLMNGLPDAEWLLTDRGYDADWFRNTLIGKGTKPCIPGRKSRKTTVKYDKRRYKRRNRPSRDIAAQYTAGQ